MDIEGWGGGREAKRRGKGERRMDNTALLGRDEKEKRDLAWEAKH